VCTFFLLVSLLLLFSFCSLAARDESRDFFL
jgi:hypothetical protein